MKTPQKILLVFFALVLPLLLAPWACTWHDLTTPIAPPPPTPTPPAVSVTMTGSTLTFIPAAVTITLGSGGVVFYNLDPFPHTVEISDTAAACVTNQFVNPYPGSPPVTFGSSFFPVTGLYNYHCQFHTGCFGGPCDGTCAPMAGTVQVIP